MSRLVLASSLLLFACTPAPVHHDPFAGLDLQAAAYPNLSAALMLSANTKSAVQYAETYEAKRPPLGGPLGADKVMDRVADTIKQNFKSVKQVGSLDAAKSIDADVVVMLDAYFDFQNPNGPGSAKIDLNLKLVSPAGAPIDEAQIRVKANVGFFATPAQNIAEGTKQAAEKLEAFIKGSAKLGQLNKARAGLASRENPSAAAPPPILAQIRSDIDDPAIAAGSGSFGEDDLAVVIGVEKYQDLPASDFSAGDAALVMKYLVSLGIKERNIETLLDERATKSAITKAVEFWLPNHTKKNGRVFVYYSGHGAPDPATGDAYLVPADGDPNYLVATGYPIKRLYEKLGELPSSEVAVVLDSCFSGAGGRSVLAKGARPLVLLREAPALPPKVAVLAAAQATQISSSSPQKGHGLLTYYFLKAVKEGKRSLTEAYRSLKPLVEDEAKSLNAEQSPSLEPGPEKIPNGFLLRR
jgi:hypothetical protein